MLSDVERLVATDQITRLIYAYPERLDRGDFEGVAGLFDKGVWEPIGMDPLRGPEMAAWLEANFQRHGDGLGTRHVTTNVVVDVDDDGQSASASSYILVFQTTDTLPLQLIFQGRYRDTFARTDGTWHFTRRVALHDGFGALHEHLTAHRRRT